MNDAPLLRLVYASRSVAGGQRHLDELREIAAAARSRNPERDISGVLLAAHAHYLQLLEGPRAAVEALFETLLLDPRHTEVELLKLEPANERHFPAHAAALVERNEVAGDIADRVRELRQEPDADAADFVRLFSVPRVSKAQRVRMRGAHGGVVGVVFASPGGLWAASVVDHIAQVAGERVGRTTISDLDAGGARSLIEYADLSVDGVGAVRGIALTRPHASVASLFERVALIVLVVTASDATDAPAHLREWAALAQVRRARPKVLVASSLSADRLDELTQELRQQTGLDIATVSVKPHDAGGVWAAAAQRLRERAAARPASDSDPAAALQTLLALPGCRGAVLFEPVSQRLLALVGGVAEARAQALVGLVGAQRTLAERLPGGPIEDIVIDGRDERIVVRALGSGICLGAFADPRGMPLPALRAVLRTLDG